MKIVKIVATSCQILRRKCTKSFVGWGSAPDPAGGAYSARQDPLAGFYGRTSKGGEGRVREGMEGEEGRGPPALPLHPKPGLLPKCSAA